MTSLSDHLAKRRILYPSPAPGAPSILAIEIPLRNRGSALALDRYHLIIIETKEEYEEIEKYLREPHPAADLLDKRPSQVTSETIMIAVYEPPEPEWPWLSISRWPTHLRRHIDIEMARGCYSMEAFVLFHEMQIHLDKMARSFDPTTIKFIVASTLPRSGKA